MSEFLTDAQLREREAAYLLRRKPASLQEWADAGVRWAEITTIQEPSLLARLREAEALLTMFRDQYTFDLRPEDMDRVQNYFARAKGEA